jgi:hypothetical protein
MTDTPTPEQLSIIERLLDAHAAGEDVTIWEDEFLTDLGERYEKYGLDLRVSDRQWESIEKMAEKYL